MGDREFQTAWLCMVTGVPSGAFAPVCALAHVYMCAQAQTPTRPLVENIRVRPKSHYFFNALPFKRVSFFVLVFIGTARRRHDIDFYFKFTPRFLSRSSSSFPTFPPRIAPHCIAPFQIRREIWPRAPKRLALWFGSAESERGAERTTKAALKHSVRRQFFLVRFCGGGTSR